MSALLTWTPAGLYCSAGDFHIDPSRPVHQAVLTHAHGDHACAGSDRYFCTPRTQRLAARRLGRWAVVRALPFGAPHSFGPVTLSLHPAGHIYGSAQVRLEHQGEVWVVTGDFKRQPDPTCLPFEVVKCDTLVTECTFADPRFVWPATETVIREVLAWLEVNRAEGALSVLLCYATGKAQRLLAELAPFITDPILADEQIVYRSRLLAADGIPQARTVTRQELSDPRKLRSGLALLPPGRPAKQGLTAWSQVRVAHLSGWSKQADGGREGFALSDHADWPALLQTIADSGATRLRLMHGESARLEEHLSGSGLDVRRIQL